MKILLGNTGRGGEQCIFTSVVHAYRVSFPDAYITVCTCPQYETLWRDNKDINKWHGLKYEPGDENAGDPVGAYVHLMNKYEKEYDLVEFPCEYACSKNADKSRSTLRQCYDAIKKPVFAFDDIECKVFIFPTDEETKQAKRISDENPILILLSMGGNSVVCRFQQDEFDFITETLEPYGTVAYTGTTGRNHMPADRPVKGAKDLRDISYGCLYALAGSIKLFVGQDSATAWVVSGTPGVLITLRGDPFFPLCNTGLVKMGYRNLSNTLEMEVGEFKDIIYSRIKTRAEEI